MKRYKKTLYHASAAEAQDDTTTAQVTPEVPEKVAETPTTVETTAITSVEPTRE